MACPEVELVARLVQDFYGGGGAVLECWETKQQLVLGVYFSKTVSL